jgi:hypothetical protein
VNSTRCGRLSLITVRGTWYRLLIRGSWCGRFQRLHCDYAQSIFAGPSGSSGVRSSLPCRKPDGGDADLTDPAEAATLDTNAQELTGDWRSYATRIPPAVPPGPHTGVPPTHDLGNELFTLGKHQGLISFSATLPDYKILVVFPDRLKGTGDYLQYSFHDDRGAMQIKRVPA